MPPTDDQHFPLPSVRTRRSISVRDYKLPKPYRKKKFVEDAQPMSPLRIGLLVFSGLVIASLVTVLAMLARDNLDAPQLLVVSAPKPAPALAPVLPEPPAPAAAALAQRPEAPAQRPAARPAALPAAVPRRHEEPAPRIDAPAADPDVVLITAILMLTPPSLPDPPAPDLQAMKP